MAGDWIPAFVELPGKPEILSIARLAKMDRHQVIGLMVHFWIWASTQTDSQTINGVTLDDLPVVVGGTKEFWSMVSRVGWIVEDRDDESLFIPNADWISKAGKARMAETKRKQVQRRQGLATPVPDLSQICPEFVPDLSQICPDSVPKKSDKNGTREEKRREEKRDLDPNLTHLPESFGSELGQKSHSEQPAATPEDPVVLEFPTEGKPRGPYRLRESKLAEYRATYPSLDVMAECVQALQWCRDNPRKRKTLGGMPAFLTNWLNRSVNKGSRSRASPSTAKHSAGKVYDPQAADKDPNHGKW